MRHRIKEPQRGCQQHRYSYSVITGKRPTFRTRHRTCATAGPAWRPVSEFLGLTIRTNLSLQRITMSTTAVHSPKRISQCHAIFTLVCFCIFTVRRYALHGLCDRNSVRPSVCHTRALCPHVSTYDHDFFTVWQPYHSSFWGYHDHPKIRRGSPRARALNEGGVSTNWRFSTNKPPYLRNGARYDKGYY